MDFKMAPHMLRYTYITNLIYEGVDPKTVQYLAGRENSKMTMDIYAKVKYNKPENLNSAVNAALGLRQNAPEFRDFVGLPMGLPREESPKTCMNVGLFGSKLGEYGLKAARRAPQFPKR